jgi:hypothetical protein
MRKLLVYSVAMAIIFIPFHAHAGHGGHTRGQGFSDHHGFRDGHRFLRQPFFAWGTGGGWMDPAEIVVIPQVVVPQVAVALSIPAPPADPKFLFPPIPSSASPAGSHTVIVQRGSQIEVQTFLESR